MKVMRKENFYGANVGMTIILPLELHFMSCVAAISNSQGVVATFPS